MNQQKISAHQVGVISGILFFTLKMSALPSLIYKYNGTGAILSTIFVILLNFMFLWLVVWLKKKYKNESLYAIFCKKFGVFVSKLLYFVFFAFFVLKLLLILSDGFTFIKDVADEEFSVLNLFVCLLPIISALAYSGMKNMGRTCEFFFPVVIISLLLLIIFSFVPVSNWGLGSLIRYGFGGFANSIFRLSFWTGDLFALLIFLDKIELKQKKYSQIFLPFGIMALLLLIIFVIYYVFYQETSVFHTNVLNDIVQYAIGTSGGWHMDIFAIIAFMFNLYLQGGVLMYCANECLKKVFNFEYSVISLVFINLLIVAIEYIYLTDYLKYIAFAENYLCYFSAIIIVLVPILLVISMLGKKRLKNESS